MTSVSGPRVFLSASVPLPTRNPAYFATANLPAIRDAVRALTMVIVEKKAELVFGGHPAITPMIRLQVSQTGAPVGDRFVLFQSRFFASGFPADDAFFERVVLVDEVPNDRDASLKRMREAMLADRFDVGIFIGGMEGVEHEYDLFRRTQPHAQALPLASTGAAAANIFGRYPDLQRNHPYLLEEISYLTLMREIVQPSPADSHKDFTERMINRAQQNTAEVPMRDDNFVPNERLLEFYQSIVTRMAGNSSSLKGWGVSVGTAVIGFSIKDGPPTLSWLALVPLLMFFVLDAYYLAAERANRAKFNSVARSTERLELTIEGEPVTLSGWLKAALRPMTWGIYFVLGLVAIVVAFNWIDITHFHPAGMPHS